MSAIAISYRSLDNASSEARDVSKRLDNYANSIERTVYNKLNNYNGEWTSNIRSASNSALSKVRELREEADSYSNYATDIKSVKDACKSVDKAVRSEVSDLTAKFKNANGIRNSWIENTFYFLVTKIDNANAITRWIDDGVDQIKAKTDSFLDKIEQWFDYEGGKELIINGLVAVLEVVLGVISVITAVSALVAAIAGGAILGIVVAVAGIVSGVIATVNGIANLINEGMAYYQTNVKDNPAYGVRRSKVNSIQDWLRTDTDSKFWHGVATAIDITDAICSTIDMLGGFVENSYKWITGTDKSLDTLKMKDIFSKDTWNAFKGKITGGLKNSLDTFKSNFSGFLKSIKEMKFSNITSGLKDIGNTFKDGMSDVFKGIKKADFSKFKMDVKNQFTDFMNSLKNHYFDFSKLDTASSSLENIKGTIESFSENGFKGVGDELYSEFFKSKVEDFDEKVADKFGLSKIRDFTQFLGDMKEKIGNLKDASGSFVKSAGDMKNSVSSFMQGNDPLESIKNFGTSSGNFMESISKFLKNIKGISDKTILNKDAFAGQKEVLDKLSKKSNKNVSLSDKYVPKAS